MLFLVISTPRPERPSAVAKYRQAYWRWIEPKLKSGQALFVYPNEHLIYKSRCRLEAENAALRHQLIVLQRKVRGRVPFTNSDRLFFVQLYRSAAGAGE